MMRNRYSVMVLSVAISLTSRVALGVTQSTAPAVMQESEGASPDARPLFVPAHVLESSALKDYQGIEDSTANIRADTEQLTHDHDRAAPVVYPQSKPVNKTTTPD